MSSTPTSVGDLEPIIVSLANFKRADLAEEMLQEFGKRSINYDQYDNIAKCFFKIKLYEQAIKYAEKTLAVAGSSPQLYTARFNLINIYNHANYPEKALQYIKLCQASIPDDVDIILEKAYTMFLLNRKVEAEEILQDTLVRYADRLAEETKTKILFNLGTYYLYRDEFQAGLKLFLEEGEKMRFWNTETIFSRNSTVFENSGKNYIPWDGRPKPGKPIIVHAEAGIGDEIINVRFMKKLQDAGMDPYWFNPYKDRTGLLKVFQRHGWKVITNLNQVSGSEIYYAQSMHLPVSMNLGYSDLWSGPYIHAHPDYIEKWRWVKGNKPAVGVRWQGNPVYDHDLHRSLPLAEILDVFSGKDVDLYSLQKDNGLEQLDGRITDLSDRLESWEDTLGCIHNLDYVITSCTSVAHASAAMGKKTYVLVPISAYYVWSHSGPQSPWYGSNVALLRQEKPRVWGEPIAKLRSAI